MDSKELATDIVGVILYDLADRAGFDEWWENIDPDIKESIHKTLVYKTQTVLDVNI